VSRDLAADGFYAARRSASHRFEQEGQTNMPQQPTPQHHERRPGIEFEMTPKPKFEDRSPHAGKLDSHVALVTGETAESAARWRWSLPKKAPISRSFT
jgi:hypothetical protein